MEEKLLKECIENCIFLSQENFKSNIQNFRKCIYFVIRYLSTFFCFCVTLMKMSPLTAVLKCPHYERRYYSNESEGAAEVPSLKDGLRE